MRIHLNLNSVEDYKKFLRIKALPRFSFEGREAIFSDEYAELIGVKKPRVKKEKYDPAPWLFDYQRDISGLAIRKKKFAIFAQCGLGKTAMLLEFARHVSGLHPKKCVLIVAPLMVVRQTVAEADRFYADGPKPKIVRASELQEWLDTGSGIGITNYESLRDGLAPGKLVGLIADESSTMKSAYGKWGNRLIDLGKGLEWKLCLTGTPAPNDRIEYANHAVFLDREPTVNSFLARYFINRGETQNRWELKSHALRPFYRGLSDWCIFLNNPGTYGWKDNVGSIPPINVHIHDVEMTEQQTDIISRHTGALCMNDVGGIADRSKFAQLAKGNYKGESVKTNKPEYIRQLVDGFGSDVSTIVWCIYNPEQETMERTFPDAGSISGDTPDEKRFEIVGDFLSGKRKRLISKAKVLGFGLNLQICTKMVFSGIQDSWEMFHQCVKRANRYGSTEPLDAHIPVTDIERPMLDTVLRKANRIDVDTKEQETLFREICADALGVGK